MLLMLIEINKVPRFLMAMNVIFFIQENENGGCYFADNVSLVVICKHLGNRSLKGQFTQLQQNSTIVLWR